MIKSLTIKNHESHKDSYLEFSSGTNVIIGENDTGKSSILRALKLVVQNTAGLNYLPIYNLKAVTECILETGEENLITRQRSKTINNYLLNEEILEGFGQNVPDEIEKILNISEVNIQSQKEPDFLLSNTSGQIAKYLNQIVNLDIIDTTLANIEKRKREANSKLEYNEKSLKNQNEELKKYANLDVIEKEIESLEILTVQYDDKKLKLRNVKIYLDEKKEEEIIINELNKIINHEKEVEYIGSLILQHKELRNKIEKATDINEKINNLIKETKIFNNRIKYENEVNDLLIQCRNAKDKKNQLINIIDQYNKLNNLKKEIRAYRKIIRNEKEVNILLLLNTDRNELEKQFNKVKIAYGALNIERERLKDTKLQLKQNETEFNRLMPEVCPLCGNKI